MIRATSITSDVPDLELRARDVLLEEDDAPHQVVLYRALPLNYKLLIPVLVARGGAIPCDLADAGDLLSVPPPTLHLVP
jgi:hypothetical protein